MPKCQPAEPTCPISRVEVTTDNLTDRGGLILFNRYLFKIGLLSILGETFGHLRKNLKGLPILELFHQVICFLVDGTRLSMTRFDELRQDPGYAASIETRPDRLASSHQVKRFFKLFAIGCWPLFRRILRRLFIWRLKIEQPRIITLMADTVVLDNDQAVKRHGVSPTYKKEKGFQPWQINWQGFTVDALFRSGRTHGNHQHQAMRMITDLAKQIRAEYRPDVTILVRHDAAFFDAENFAAFDTNNLLFVASGKLLPFVKTHVDARRQETWGEYDHGRQSWDYLEFGYRCESWSKFYRAFYTVPRTDEHGQLQLDFARPESIIPTNLGCLPRALQNLSANEQAHWLKPETIIACHHERGADELPHRAPEDFGTEALPFKRFPPNAAFYYLMPVAFFLFEAFKRDVLKETLPITAYATTIRRRVFDIAAKIVSTGRQLVMKLRQATLDRLNFFKLWERSARPPLLRI